MPGMTFSSPTARSGPGISFPTSRQVPRPMTCWMFPHSGCSIWQTCWRSQATMVSPPRCSLARSIPCCCRMCLWRTWRQTISSSPRRSPSIRCWTCGTTLMPPSGSSSPIRIRTRSSARRSTGSVMSMATVWTTSWSAQVMAVPMPSLRARRSCCSVTAHRSSSRVQATWPWKGAASSPSSRKPRHSPSSATTSPVSAT